MTLKDDIVADIESVFLDEDDFAERRVVEGQEVVAVFYEDELQPADSNMGLVVKTFVLQAKTGDLPPAKKPGATIDIDGRLYVVQTWRTDCGMAVVKLTAKQ